MLKVALTGGIGSGKSEAGRIFQELGATVIDSDEISREVIERGTEGFDEVIAIFGDQVLTNGNIDRKKLGEIVFSDKLLREKLEQIIHPKVKQRFDFLVSQASDSDILINQIPLLVETNGAIRFDKVIVVTAPLEKRFERLHAKGMPEYEIKRRMDSQVQDSQRLAIADYVIENNGAKEELLREVEKIFDRLKVDASNH